MSDGFSFDVIGNAVILENLALLEVEALAKVHVALEHAGEVGKQYAEDHAPVSDISEPGYVHMKDQYYATVQENVLTLGNDSDHIVYVELGTYKMRAQPTLVPGAIAAGEELKKQLEGLI